jgi:hypothetical protein
MKANEFEERFGSIALLINGLKRTFACNNNNVGPYCWMTNTCDKCSCNPINIKKPKTSKRPKRSRKVKRGPLSPKVNETKHTLLSDEKSSQIKRGPHSVNLPWICDSNTGARLS